MLKILLISLILALSSFTVHASQLVVLQYHHISDSTPFSTSLSKEKFAEHMQMLADNNYQVVDLSWALQQLDNGKALADKSVAITFDDGFNNIFDNGLPILEAHGFPFSVFVNTQPIEQGLNAYMSWDRLKELQKRGGAVLNHGHDHQSMLPKSSEDIAAWQTRVRESIIQAQQLLEQHLAIKDKIVAYPYGEFNLGVEEIVAELGFIGFGQHSGPLNSSSVKTRLPRFPAAGLYANLKTLQPKLQSLAFDIKLIEGQESWLPETDAASLIISITSKDFYTSMLSCFYNGERFKPEKLESRQFKIAHPLNRDSIRERTNCTAPSIAHDGKRHYWWSHPYFFRNDE